MTELQFNAIKAFAIGTKEYEAFKLSVKNRKMLDQFMNRVWPKTVEKSKKVFMKKNVIIELLRWRVDVERTGLGNFSPMPEFKYSGARLNAELLWNQTKQVIRFFQNKEKIGLAEGILTMEGAFFTNGDKKIMSRTRFRLGLDSSFNHNFGFVHMRRDLNEFSDQISLADEVIIRDVHPVSLFSEEASERFLSKMPNLIEKFYKEKTIRKKYTSFNTNKSLNIGIEIEYEGQWTNMEKRLIKRGLVSFHSGYDGYERSGQEKLNARLRENRIRLNGVYSLKALEHVLAYMIRNGDRMTTNSGMHYHVDLGRYYQKLMAQEYDNNYVTSRLRYLFYELKEDTVLSLLKIFEFDKELKEIEIMKSRESYDWSSRVQEKVLDRFLEYLILKTEFTTIEWRMGSKTLLYRKIILQILVAIHITQAIKTGRSVCNENYLQSLGKIAEELY